jgi:putative membrane protein
MLTTFSSRRLVPFRQNRFLQVLAASYAIVWIGLAIDPWYRYDWALENLLVVAGMPVLVLVHRRHPISDLSYLLITVFLMLHALGAHYTYSQVPIGALIKRLGGVQRNHYDRIVHFAFGLLLAYPFREWLARSLKVRGFWGHALAICLVLAFSALYELLEWLAAMVLSQRPQATAAFLGVQDDFWDAQKDVLSALVGAGAASALGFLPRPGFFSGRKTPRRDL